MDAGLSPGSPSTFLLPSGPCPRVSAAAALTTSATLPFTSWLYVFAPQDGAQGPAGAQQIPLGGEFVLSPSRWSAEPLQSWGPVPGSLDGSQAIGALCLGVGRRGVPWCLAVMVSLGTALSLVQDGPVTTCVSQAAAANTALPRGTAGSHRARGTPPGSQRLPGCPQGAESDLAALPPHPPHPPTAAPGTVCSSLDPRGLKPAQNTLLPKASRGCSAGQHPRPGVAAHLLAPGEGHAGGGPL